MINLEHEAESLTVRLGHSFSFVRGTLHISGRLTQHVQSLSVSAVVAAALESAVNVPIEYVMELSSK